MSRNSNNFQAYDADGHVFENEREIYEFLPGMFRSHEELLRTNLFPAMDSWNRTALSITGRYKEGSTSDLYKKANYEITGREWKQFLDMADLAGTVLYPTAGLGFGRIKEVEWGIALAQAYNDWIHDRFMKADPRIRAIALLPVQDPQAAADELRRCVTKLKMVGGLIIAGHRRKPLGDSLYDPIYKAAQELDTVLSIHAGGPGNRFEMFESAIEARCLGHPTSLMTEMTSMMFRGVFDRFPKVRFAFLEGGVAWALFLRERMQEAYEQWKVQAPELKKSPDEHLSSGRIFFHAELDERIIPYAAQVLGAGSLLYASDFPHVSPEKSLHEKDEFMEREDVSDQVKAKIMRENALNLYKIQA